MKRVAVLVSGSGTNLQALLESERRGENPIVSIHDQGAGGNGNVLKEISAPNGAEIDIRNMVVGDPTMSEKELRGAEFQENDAMLKMKKVALRVLFQSFLHTLP